MILVFVVYKTPHLGHPQTANVSPERPGIVGSYEGYPNLKPAHKGKLELFAGATHHKRLTGHYLEMVL